MAETLHIYPQESEHMDAFILGSRSALLQLRALIDKALEGKPEDGEFMQSDGEGYPLSVRCVAEAWADALPTAYDMYRGKEWSDADNAAFQAAMDGRAYG
ncbi:hypothetical protein [Pseudorhodoferax sp. Leaf274]|uniref:hypothetical protein n=1 Tax=Pseudorhodoferax sp. Leaf274 TaxID=1736318 RepID=UPI00070363B8|nr:hypothetical protein [Pseudorhodoferax sp. Leaf274]KQP36123.1 hypothetical protein ASF44_16265 [Pseudorhodoferax sp. Leaf274]